MGFRLSIPMGYLESVPFFKSMDIVKDVVKNTMASVQRYPDYPLEKLVETPPSDNKWGAYQTRVKA